MSDTPDQAPRFRLTLELVAVLITIALQAVATISWAAKMDARVKALEERPDVSKSVAVLEERTGNMVKQLDRLVDVLDPPRR